jgi:hypothetical protein
MAPSRLVAAMVFGVIAAAGLFGSLLYTGRMAKAVGAIEGRRRSYRRPAVLTWSDYSRLCPRGPYMARLWQANGVFAIGLIGVMLSLG